MLSLNALSVLPFLIPSGEPSVADFDQAIAWPEVGEHQLHILTPKVLELDLINTQAQPGGWDLSQVPPAQTPPITAPTIWDFLTPLSPTANAPTAADFVVSVNGSPMGVASVGFSRRPVVAPLRPRDLRISNSIFLVLADSIPVDATVSVIDAPTAAHPVLTGLNFTATATANRFNPAIHVNQLGFTPAWADASNAVKRAFVGRSLGDLGELKVNGSHGLTPATGFQIIRASDSAVVYPASGTKPMTPRVDGYLPSPFYENVLEAEFSDFVTPGLYRIRVPGMGASLPFRVEGNIASTLGRTFGLGLYHQRSGQAKSFPYTRFTDAADHVAPATVPFDQRQYSFTYNRLANDTSAPFHPGNVDPPHAAMRARDADSLLFPYVGDVLAWWPMDGDPAIIPANVILGFNGDNYGLATVSDPFAGHPTVTAFGAAPSRTLEVGQESAHGPFGKHFGRGFANTYRKDASANNDPNAPTGLLVSANFTIDKPYLAFVIGGGNQPYDLGVGGTQTGVVAANLVVGGAPVLTATGNGSNALTWTVWDVSAYAGQSARLELIDSSATSFLLADEFHLTSQTSVKDLSAHRRHATAVGGPTQLTGTSARLYGALSFDGVDDHLLCDELGSLSTTSEFTVSAWIRVANLNEDQVLTSKAASADGATGFAFWYEGATRKLKARVGPIVATSTATIPHDGWQFAAMRFKANDPAGLEIYLNGVSAGPAASTTSLTNMPTNAAPFLVGNYSDLPAALFWQGAVDDFRLRAKFVSLEELAGAMVGDGPWVDVAGGHFDAGDYSKYMINSALAVEALAFAVDQILAVPGTSNPPPGPDPLDNLGVPESGDGICDLLQEAKWEADYIAKMQDVDGGFFFIVYPRNRTFEDNVLPSQGDPQVVYPKSLAATGSATAALATLASSPAFQRHYPQAASSYMAKALLGWQFIANAINEHGLAGSFQYLTHYGAVFEARDEVAWAAAALFAATGEPQYEAKLKEWIPFDPTLQFGVIPVGFRDSRRYTWDRLFEGVGGAFRAYAFANRGARQGMTITYDPALIISQTYHSHVLAEIHAAAADALADAEDHAFRTSMPSAYKASQIGVYHFPESLAFDLVASQLIAPNAAYRDAVVSNVDYQLGGNPVNISFISGLGWGRLREFVSLFSANDDRKLPPTGFTNGSISSSTAFLAVYNRLLGLLTYPSDLLNLFPLYERYADSWNPNNEFVIPQHCRAMATSAFLMKQAGEHTVAWQPSPSVSIVGLPAQPLVGQTYTLTLSSSGPPMSDAAQVVWEARNREPEIGHAYQYPAASAGEHWIEVEVLWKDGRRSFLRHPVTIFADVTNRIEHYQPPLDPGLSAFYDQINAVPSVRLYYPLDDNGADVRHGVPLSAPSNPAQYNLALLGNANFETGPFQWPTYATSRPNVRALRLHGPGDGVTTTSAMPNGLFFPANARWFSLEMMLHVRAYNNANQAHAFLPWMFLGDGNPNKLQVLRFYWSTETQVQFNIAEAPVTTSHFPIGQWLHVKLYVDEEQVVLLVDGQVVRRLPSSQLAAWLKPTKSISFGLTNFDGWVNDIIYKSDSTSPPVPLVLPANHPEIAVFQGASASGADRRHDNLGLFSFGSVTLSQTSSPQTFTLKNIGTADLTGLAVSSSSAEFTVTQPSVSTLAPDQAATFTVTFTPALAGTRSGAVSIASNDADENPFEIPVGGVGDDAPPTIVSAAGPASGVYLTGQALDFTITYSEPVTVTGSPRLSLDVGGAVVPVAYLGGSGGATLTFRRVVGVGEEDSDGVALDSAIQLNGGTIRDSANNAAQLTFTPPNTSFVLVQGHTSAVISVTSSTADGSYKASANLAIQVVFDEPVFVTGTPQLALATGAVPRLINYAGGSGTTTLTFSYGVQAGENSPDLDCASTTALTLNGGTIKHANGNVALLTLPVPGAAGSLAANKALIIDTTPPAVTLITPPANGNYLSGQNLDFLFSFSEQVSVAGDPPSMALAVGANNRAAAYVSGSGSATLTFRYVVQPSDFDADGVIAISPLALNGGTIRDAVGNDVTLTFTPPNAGGVTVIPPSTTIDVVGDDLEIADTDGGDTNDALRLRQAGSNIVVQDLGGGTLRLTAALINAGAAGHGTSTATIPLAAFPGLIVVRTFGGADSLEVDWTAALSRGVNYHGGAPNEAPGDSLAIVNGTATQQNFVFTGGDAGTVALDAWTLSYDGLEPIVSTVSSASVTLDYRPTGSSLTITPSALSSARTRVANLLSESVEFLNPSGALTILGADAVNDAADVNGFGTSNQGGPGLFHYDGGTGGETLNIRTPVTLGGIQAEATFVKMGGVLRGGGTVVGNLTVENEGMIEPGGPNIGEIVIQGGLTCAGQVSFQARAPFTTASHDRLAVHGGVSLAGAELSFSGGGGPTSITPRTLTLIDNFGGNPVVTDASTLPAVPFLLTLGSTSFNLSYNGGASGDDVVLEGDGLRHGWLDGDRNQGNPTFHQVDIYYDHRDVTIGAVTYANQLATDASLRNVVNQAMDRWESASGGALRFIRKTDAAAFPNAVILNVGFGDVSAMSAPPGEFGAATVTRDLAEYAINGGLAWADGARSWNMITNGLPDPPGTANLVHAMMHLLGHAIGLGHDDADLDSVMRPDYVRRDQPSAQDQANLRAIYRPAHAWSGSAANDLIEFRQRSGQDRVFELLLNGAVAEEFEAARFRQLTIEGGAGDDAFRLDAVHGLGRILAARTIFTGGGDADTASVINQGAPPNPNVFTSQIVVATGENSGHLEAALGAASPRKIILFSETETILAGESAITTLRAPDVAGDPNNAIILRKNAAAGRNELADGSGDDFPLLVFPNPTSRLSITLGNQGDNLTVEDVDDAFAPDGWNAAGSDHDLSPVFVTGGSGPDTFTIKSTRQADGGAYTVVSAAGVATGLELFAGQGADTIILQPGNLKSPVTALGGPGDDVFTVADGTGPETASLTLIGHDLNTIPAPGDAVSIQRSLTFTNAGAFLARAASISVTSAMTSVDGDLSLSGPLTLSGAQVATTGAGAVVLGGNVAVAGASASILAGRLDLGGAIRTVTTPDVTASGAEDLRVEAVVSNGGLTKDGAGTLSLYAANAYTGPTTILAGTLRASNTTGSATGTSAVSVAAGAKLTGAIGLTGVVSSSGAILPGDSPRTLRLGSTTLAGGSLTMDVLGTTPGSEHDQLIVTGALNLGDGVATLALLGPHVPTANDVVTLIANDGDDPVLGQFAGLPPFAGVSFNGQTYYLSYAAGDGNDVALLGSGRLPSYQSWKLAELGSATAPDDGDNDGDGLRTRFEYGFNLNPNSWADGDLDLGLRVYPDGHFLRALFHRRTQRNDVTLEIQVANHPAGPWTSIAASVHGSETVGLGGIVETDLGGGLKRVEVKDFEPATGAGPPRRFLRALAKP